LILKKKKKKIYALFVSTYKKPTTRKLLETRRSLKENEENGVGVTDRTWREGKEIGGRLVVCHTGSLGGIVGQVEVLQ
jgi:hypothetical protein